PLAEVVTAATDYSTALVAAKQGGKTEVAVKNQKRKALENLLITLASYVTMTSKGDRAVMVSSGFDLVKVKEPSPPLGKPEIIKVVDGVNPGELKVIISRVTSARNYMYEYTQDPLAAQSDWVGQNSTLSKMLFKDLESGKKYWCRVIAYGRNEQLAYSDPVSRIVQ
ncbi:MAG TPA: hypothetical protein VEV15_03340, partial [Flavisolibacter sp.]|nr:hypothetical protein [Flavisolibacter sp.]